MKLKKYISIALVLIVLILSAILPSSASSIQMGDVNADGVISIMDATLIQKKINNIKTSEKYYIQYSDFDYSDRTDITDATLIQKYLAENIAIYNRYLIAINNNSASIYKYFGTAENVKIPNRFNGYGCDITRISKYAFQNNSTIVTVTLPSTVKIIDDYAFNNCPALKTIYSYNRSLKWGNSFVNCPMFQSINFM